MKPDMNLVVLGQRILLLVIFLVIVFVIVGCNDSTPKSNLIVSSVPQKFAAATTLEGIVSDDVGPVKSGTVKALSNNSQEIASVTLQDSDRYKLEIPAGTGLPIVLSFHSDGSSGKKGKEYITAVVHANLTQYDINPLSTAIAKKAKELGGYTHANLVVAAESMGTVPDSNKMTSGFRGDPTKQYGGWH